LSLTKLEKGSDANRFPYFFMSNAKHANNPITPTTITKNANTIIIVAPNQLY
jgi:hypothetical protein